MKSVLSILVGVGAIAIHSCSPDAEEILKKSYQASKSVKNGYYELNKDMKYGSSSDTISYLTSGYFKKDLNDTTSPTKFHIKTSTGPENVNSILNTGSELVTYSTRRNKGEILNRENWTDQTKDIIQSSNLYLPFTSTNSYPLPADSSYESSSIKLELLDDQVVNDYSCYRIRINILHNQDTTKIPRIYRDEIQLWINKKDFLPIKYITALDMNWGGNSINQYESWTLTKYKLNDEHSEKQIDLAAIPSGIELKESSRNYILSPLPNQSYAPGFNLKTLENESISLSDYNNNLVLLDFFYKACYPCIQAFPALQSLSDKYKDRGLHIIGIDPIDSNKDEISKLMDKHGVTFTVALADSVLAKKFNVSSYPTTYLVDRDGRIVFSKVGYGEATKSVLEKVIEDYLNSNLTE